MQKQSIETTENELMRLYVKVKRERLKSEVPYNKTSKILVRIYNKSKQADKWRLDF